jgi:hypothetical protein
MVPHDADQLTSVVAENCKASLTTTLGFIGSIENAEDEALDPDRVVFCGLLLAVSVNARVAVKVPDAVGLNTTLAEQLAAAARLAAHVLLEIAKAAALVPEMATLLIVMAALVPLLSVTDCGELVDPTAVFANEMPVGAAVTLPVEEAPVPVKATVCGLLLPVSLKLRVAVRIPAALGLNTMVAVQLAAAARLVPHVLLEIVKSAAFVPEIVIPLMVSAEVVPFFNVAICDALLAPTLTVPYVIDEGVAVTVLVAAVAVPVSATL